MGWLLYLGFLIGLIALAAVAGFLSEIYIRPGTFPLAAFASVLVVGWLVAFLSKGDKKGGLYVIWVLMSFALIGAAIAAPSYRARNMSEALGLAFAVPTCLMFGLTIVGPLFRPADARPPRDKAPQQARPSLRWLKLWSTGLAAASFAVMGLAIRAGKRDLGVLGAILFLGFGMIPLSLRIRDRIREARIARHNDQTSAKGRG